MSAHKVLEFKLRKNSKAHSIINSTEIVDISGRRSEIIENERRKVKRTILSEFVGVWAVLPLKGLQKCALFDISKAGLALDLETQYGQFAQGDVVSLRVYLNRSTYFSFEVVVQNAREIFDEGVFRHGCTLTNKSSNIEALSHFVSFIEAVSTNLKIDSGDITVSHLSLV
jgi:hypothetical protein